MEAFEKEHQITLPSPYREFILQVAMQLRLQESDVVTQVSNGGPGPPRQGLVKLGEAVPMPMAHVR